MIKFEENFNFMFKRFKTLAVVAMVLMLGAFSALMLTACNGEEEEEYEVAVRTGITATFTPPATPMAYNTTLAGLVPHLTLVANYDNDTTQSIQSITVEPLPHAFRSLMSLM